MGHLVRDPQRQQLGRQSHAVRLRVRPPGEVLEADKRDAAPTHYQLAGIRRAHADHDVQIDWTIGLEHFGRTAQRVFGHRDDVHVLEQAFEIGAIGAQRRVDDRLGVRRLGIEHVILPVRAQHRTMAIEILVVRRGRIWRGQRCEEFWNKIDEHCAGCRPIWEGSQRISISRARRSDLTLRLRRRTQPAANFGQELSLGRRQTLDTAGADLVEHAIDLSRGARIGVAPCPSFGRARRHAAAAADPRRL